MNSSEHNEQSSAVPAHRPPLDRRGALAVTGVLGASVGLLLAGCSSAPSSGAAAQDAPSEASAGATLGPASAVPVGGGTVFAAQKVVVTQPTAGTYRGFSAICTHQGCTLASVSGATINCPCHGSKFKITDGSVAHGPADEPLPAKPVTVQGGQLRLG